MAKHLRATIAAALILAAAASIADAQVSFRYRRQGRNYVLDVWYDGGSSSGYGYGYGGFAPGFVYSSGNSSYGFGTNFYGSGYELPGSYGYYGYPSGLPGAWYGGARTWRNSYADYMAMSTSYRRASEHGVPEQIRRLTAQKDIDIGVRKWKSADYAGALAAFKEAVSADTTSGPAQIYMGLALVATGDARNAEKAVLSGLTSLALTAELRTIELKGMFRDGKEQAKFAAALEKAGPLAGALAYALLGETGKAKERAELAAKEAGAAAAAQRLVEYLK